MLESLKPGSSPLIRTCEDFHAQAVQSSGGTGGPSPSVTVSSGYAVGEGVSGSNRAFICGKTAGSGRFVHFLIRPAGRVSPNRFRLTVLSW